MGNAKLELCKSAYNGLETMLKNRKSVSAFDYTRAKGIGEELRHKLSGARFFKAEGLENTAVEIKSCPVELTSSGYRGISNEYFEALKKMRISKKERPYGKVEYYDPFTATSYWDAGKNKLGETVAKAESMIGTEGRHSIPTSLWEKIESLFS